VPTVVPVRAPGAVRIREPFPCSGESIDVELDLGRPEGGDVRRGADGVITSTTTRCAETEGMLGVDACRVGGVGIAIGHGVTHDYVGAKIADLVGRGRRRPDILAGVTVGPRRGGRPAVLNRADDRRAT